MNQKIVQICGLCGSGKSTIAKKLKKEFNASVYNIGEYRDLYKDEDTTWYKFVGDILNDCNKLIVIETTGINGREKLLYNIPDVKILLNASCKVLDKRINMKPIFKRGWKIFRPSKVFNTYRDKKDFNRKVWEVLETLKKTCIVIDAEKPIDLVYNEIRSKIN